MHPRRIRAVRFALSLLAASLTAACLDVDHDRDVELRDDRQLVARQRVSAATGGTLRAAGDLHRNVALVIPPGALAADTDIAIFVRYGDPRWPTIVQSFEVEPAEVELSRPAQLSIEYATEYEYALETIMPETAIEVFSAPRAGRSGFVLHPISARDGTNNRVTFATEQFGTFVPMHPALHALCHQTPRLLDPSAVEPAERVGGQLVASASGRESVHLGQGSLDSFWRSGPEHNLIVVHGLLGTPFHLNGPTSLVPVNPEHGFNGDFRNVILFQFPSGRSIAENGNALYSLIRAGRRPGFGCRVLAHSTGGLVARWALERAHADPARPDHQPGDEPLHGVVDRLVCVATPHHGSHEIATMFAGLLANIPARDAEFVAGILEAIDTPDSFTARLNAAWHPTATDYFTIAGDVGEAQGDGIVDVQSAIGVRELWSGPISHQVFSGPLYDHLSLTTLGDRTGIVDQSRAWFGKSAGDSLPIVGTVRTPIGRVSGDVEIRFTISDAESDPGFVVVQYSGVENLWKHARSRNHPFTIIETGTRPAPGEPSIFVWDTLADSVGFGGGEPVRIRVVPLGPEGRVGTLGQTGTFVVRN